MSDGYVYRDLNGKRVSVSEMEAGKLYTWRPESAVDDPTPTTNPQDQDYWPQDSLHDAAKQVVGGIKGLVPNARHALREAAERADAPPVGRAASDAFVGRALRI